VWQQNSGAVEDFFLVSGNINHL